MDERFEELGMNLEIAEAKTGDGGGSVDGNGGDKGGDDDDDLMDDDLLDLLDEAK